MTDPQVNLVQIKGQQVFTTSLIVAEGCDNRSHESTIKLIRKYQSDFEELGKLDFKTEGMDKNSSDSKSDEFFSKHGKLTEYALLNEDQATFLVTLFRNTPTVRKFKLNLVKAFRAALNSLAALPKVNPTINLPPPPTSLPPLPPPPPPALGKLKAAYKEELRLHARTQQELMQAKVRTAQLEYELALAKVESRSRLLTQH